MPSEETKEERFKRLLAQAKKKGILKEEGISFGPLTHNHNIQEAKFKTPPKWINQKEGRADDDA